MLSFQPFDFTFLSCSWNWINDPVISKLINSSPITKEQQIEWFNSLNSRTDSMIWGLLLNNKPIGVCGIKHIQEGEGEYWGYIGEKEYWGQGLGKQMMAFVENEAISLGLKLLYLHVLPFNKRAFHLYERMGYHTNEQIVMDDNNNLITMTKFL